MPSPTSLPEVAATLALKRRGLTLFLLTAAYFCSYMDRSIVAILQELIRHDLKLSDTQLALVGGLAFALFYAFLGIPVAWLADRWSRKKIIAISLAIWSAMTALTGLANNFSHLLLARIGVGVGEAGSSPPSHSMIADLYPPEKRAGAMAIYTLGIVLGGAGGAMIGGMVGHLYGWRAAMFVVGLPGVALAVMVWLFVVEPKRGLSDVQIVAEHDPMPSIWSGFVSIGRDRAALHLIAGVTLTSMIGYGHAQFGPSFVQRSFHVTLPTISLFLAPVGAVLATVSGIGGGQLANRLAARYGLRWQSWLVAILKTIALPFMMILYWTHDVTLAFFAYFMIALFASSYLGPTFSLLQGLAPIRQRAVWASITLFVINLIGLGLGPTAVGMMSDYLRPAYGEESLRYAMFIFAAITPWAIFHYWRAGVLLKRREAIGTVSV